MNTKVVTFVSPIAPTGITRRLAIRAVPLAVAVALTFGAVVGPETASAAPVGGFGEASCVYKGVTYSHGAIAQFDNGFYYKCNNGTWDFYSREPLPVTGQPITVYPVYPIEEVQVSPVFTEYDDAVWYEDTEIVLTEQQEVAAPADGTVLAPLYEVQP